MKTVDMDVHSKLYETAKQIRVQRALFQMYVEREVSYERDLKWPDKDDDINHLRHMKKFCQMKRQWAFQKWKTAELALARLCAKYSVTYQVD